MSKRTTKTTVTFQLPFVLDGFDGELPPGDYQLETDEELLEGLSFPAYRRVATHLYIHPKPGVTQMLVVSSQELAAAQLRDEISAKKETSAGRNQPAALPVLKPFSTENSEPSLLCSSSPGRQEKPTAVRKDRQMHLWHPAVVSAILVVGLAVCAWFIPPKLERTDRTVSLSSSTYEQLQLWSKHHMSENGQAPSVNEFIKQLANNWQKANPSPVKPIQASDE